MTSLISKKGNIVAICIVIIVILASCGNSNKKMRSLSVTIDPQRYFLEQIVGDKFTVTSLVPAGANPESFDPAPSQMIAINRSNAYFKVGFLGIENTLLEKVKDQSDLIVIDCSVGVDIITDGHIHNDDSDHHHAHTDGDPHYWSSINSAKKILDNMYNAVVELDRENKEYYTNNYNSALAQINVTDSIIKSYLAKSECKSFIIYHPALSYFADEYGLTQLSIEHEGKNPSPSQLKGLIDTAKLAKVHAVLIQQEFDVKNAETIAKEIKAKTHAINLLAYDWHTEMIGIAKAITDYDE